MEQGPSSIKITKEEIMKLPLLSFSGKIHVISSSERLQESLELLNREKIIGFDTETKPVFRKGVTHSVALLQLSTQNDAFLFQLKKVGLPRELLNILSSEQIQKVGVAIHDDIKALRKICDFEPGGFIELSAMAKKRNIANLGLRSLSALFLDGRLSKKNQLSNWENPKLTDSQKMYAATDAWASLSIYLKMNEG